MFDFPFLSYSSTFRPQTFPISDRHFRPQFTFCDWCVLDYDFVGTHEHWDEDVGYVAHRTGLDAVRAGSFDGGLRVNIRPGKLTTGDYATVLLASLRPEARRGLREHFKGDFEAFGYDPERYSIAKDGEQ